MNEQRKSKDLVEEHDNSNVIVITGKEPKQYAWAILCKGASGKEKVILQFLDKYASTAELLIARFRHFGWVEIGDRKWKKEKVTIQPKNGDKPYDLVVNKVSIEKLGVLKGLK